MSFILSLFLFFRVLTWNAFWCILISIQMQRDITDFLFIFIIVQEGIDECVLHYCVCYDNLFAQRCEIKNLLNLMEM